VEVTLKEGDHMKTTGQNECNHIAIIIDNYGETCAICGEVLAGFGYWQKGSRQCRHKWLPYGEGQEKCPYCEQVREKLVVK